MHSHGLVFSTKMHCGSARPDAEAMPPQRTRVREPPICRCLACSWSPTMNLMAAARARIWHATLLGKVASGIFSGRKRSVNLSSQAGEVVRVLE